MPTRASTSEICKCLRIPDGSAESKLMGMNLSQADVEKLIAIGIWNMEPGSQTLNVNFPSLAPVAITGQYSSLTGTPDFGSAAFSNSTDFATAAQGALASTALQNQVNADWNSGSGAAQILNKPTLGTAAAQNVSAFDAAGSAAAAQAYSIQWANLTGKPSFATVATTGAYADLTGKPTIPAVQVNSDWNSVSGVSQILNKPSIPAAQVSSDWNSVSGVSQILNKPTIPAANLKASSTQAMALLALGLTTTFNVTVTGATVGMGVNVNTQGLSLVSLGGQVDGYVSSTNTVTVVVRAFVALAAASRTFIVTVFP